MLYLPRIIDDAPDPEDDMITAYYERLEQKEFDKWELTAYWNASNAQGY